MFAVDDGIAQGNLDVADIFFLIGIILGFIAAFLAASHAPAAKWNPALGWAAVGCIAFGLFLL